MTNRTREKLKSYFVKNAIPTQGHFEELIDGMLNQADDGIRKLPDNPLSIVASGDGAGDKQVLHFYEDAGSDTVPSWVLSLRPGGASGSGKGFNIGDKSGNSRLFIDARTGNLGVGTDEPKATLHVQGEDIMLSADNRRGSGIVFPKKLSDGNKDAAWIGYRLTDGGERGTLMLATEGDPQDHIVLLPSGNVGIGEGDPSHKLHVKGDIFAADGLTVQGGISIEERGTRKSIQLTSENGVLKQEDWTNARLVNSWNTSIRGHPAPGYFKDSMGTVHLRGMAGGGRASRLFTLPSSHRPEQTVLYIVIRDDQTGKLTITTDGKVSCAAIDKGKTEQQIEAVKKNIKNIEAQIRALTGGSREGIERRQALTAQKTAFEQQLIPLERIKGWVSLDGVTFRAK